MQKTCSKCGIDFNCQSEITGCWCEDLHLDQQTLVELKENYANCLCPSCLKNFEREKNHSESARPGSL